MARMIVRGYPDGAAWRAGQVRRAATPARRAREARMNVTQLDLFGEVEQAEQAARDRAQARTGWQARFERADWIARYDTQGGTPAGGRVPGWRCPDPECGEVEPGPTGFLLSINHGWDPDVPGHEPHDGRCYRVRLRQAQAQAAGQVP